MNDEIKREEPSFKNDVVTTCPICNEYEGSTRQVHMHKVKCKKATNSDPIVEAPAPEPDIKPDIPDEEVRVEVRRKRTPVGVRKPKLSAPDDDRFEYRVFNDNWRHIPGRIQDAERGDWTPVEGHKEVSVGSNDDGSAIKGILMKIPKELYEEDQALKQEPIDMVDQAIQKGTFEKKSGDNRYIPDGIKIHSNHNEP